VPSWPWRGKCLWPSTGCSSGASPSRDRGGDPDLGLRL
jgi:hypothetical protein